MVRESSRVHTKKRSDHEIPRSIKTCGDSVGIEGLSSALDRIYHEWQYPLSWSVSKPFGVTCKQNR